MKKGFKQFMLAFLVMVLMVILAACGGGTQTANNEPKSTDTPAAKETEAPKEEPKKPEIKLAQGVADGSVKIGTIGVQSGPLAFIGTPYFGGMEAYFKKVNDEGGVNGRTIELIKKDDEFKPDKSVQAMESLIFDEQVFAIVGHLGTPGVMAAESIVKEEGIPSVYFGSGAKQLTQSGANFFPVQPNYYYEGKLMAKFTQDEFNASKIVVIYRNDDVGRDGLDGVVEALEKLGKKDALPEEGKLAVNATDTDFTVPVQKAKSLNPEVVILYGLAGEVSGLLKEFEKVSFNVPMITTYSNADASFLALASAGAPNVIQNLYVMGWLDVNAEKLQPLNDAMVKYFPEVPVNAYTMAGWVAAETFVAGLKQAGDNLSWEGFIDAMNNLSFTEGLAPEISYANGAREGVTKMALSKVVKGADGSFTFQLETDFLEYK